MKKVKIMLALASLLVAIGTPCQAQFSGLKKWFNTEVVPTVKGERPLNIDPTRVRVSHDGKDILRASSEGQGSIYLDFGVAKIQTSDLQTRVAQAGAIFSGNTAVMTQVAYEQFQKFNERSLKEAQESETLTVSNTPPDKPEIEEPGSGRTVIVFNHTLSPMNYAMNGNFFKLEPQTGNEHTSSTGEFYLQFDEDISNDAKIARYFLTGSVYGLYLFKGMDKIAIQKHN